MKKIYVVFVLLLACVITLASCTTVKDYIWQNRDLIQLIINTIVEQLLQQTQTTASVSRGNVYSESKSELKTILTALNSEQFWDNIEPKIDLIIKTYESTSRGTY